MTHVLGYSEIRPAWKIHVVSFALSELSDVNGGHNTTLPSNPPAIRVKPRKRETCTRQTKHDSKDLVSAYLSRVSEEDIEEQAEARDPRCGRAQAVGSSAS